MSGVNIYANRFFVYHDTRDFVIKLGAEFPENGEVLWNAVVYLSPPTAKELAMVLSQAVTNYEKQRHVEIPTEPIASVREDDGVLQ